MGKTLTGLRITEAMVGPGKRVPFMAPPQHCPPSEILFFYS